MNVRKQSGTNTIEVVERLKARLDEVRKDLPKGWKMQIVRDQSDYILAAVNAVKEHLILGSLFAALIVWFFLSSPKVRDALALVAATLAVYFLLFGFEETVARVPSFHVSVLVFVVLFAIGSWLAAKWRLGTAPRVLIALAALALGALVPGGSLAVNPIRLLGVLVGFGMLMYFFRRSRPTIISAVAIPSSIIATFAAMRYENFTLNSITLLALTLAVGIVIDDAVVVLENIFRFMEEKKMAPAEAAVEGTKEVGMAVLATSLSLIAVFLPVAFMAGIVGRFMHSFGVTMAVAIGDDPQVTQNLGTVYVKSIPVDKRKRDQFAVMADVRNNIMPQYQRLNLRTSVGPVNAFGGGVNAQIMYWIGGPDLNQLSRNSDVLLADLKGMKNLGVIDPDTNLITGKPELGVRIDRDKASDMGVRVQDIASTLNVLVGGLKITDYYEGGEQYEVHVRAEHEYRKDPQGIAQAQVPSVGARVVQLRDVVTMAPGAGPSSVNRIQRQRQVMFTANMAPGHSAQTVMDNLVAETKKLNMPPEYSAGFTGRSREQGRAFTNFMFAFLLSI